MSKGFSYFLLFVFALIIIYVIALSVPQTSSFLDPTPLSETFDSSLERKTDFSLLETIPNEITPEQNLYRPNGALGYSAPPSAISPGSSNTTGPLYERDLEPKESAIETRSPGEEPIGETGTQETQEIATFRNAESASSPLKENSLRESQSAHFLPKRLTLRHIEGWGKGIGYGTDYSTVELLLASDYRQEHIFPMLDLRVHHFDNNSYAANLGVGGRYMPDPCSFCEMLGFNGYYDFREGVKGYYNQVGIGIEALGKRWDFRANGYFPVGNTKNRTICTYDDYGDGLCAIDDECEFTSYGYNAEVGYRLIRSRNFSLYLAAGAYYLARRYFTETRGWMARLQPLYKDLFALQAIVSHDPVFKTVVQGEIIVHLPLYRISSHKNQKPSCGFFEREIYQSIERFEVMPLGRRSCWQYNW